ncbi:hypothetical protein BH10ACT6_BH10ACT6_01230 [soil metagenome]
MNWPTHKAKARKRHRNKHPNRPTYPKASK